MDNILHLDAGLTDLIKRTIHMLIQRRIPVPECCRSPLSFLAAVSLEMPNMVREKHNKPEDCETQLLDISDSI